jgi:hypothetical protein
LGGVPAAGMIVGAEICFAMAERLQLNSAPRNEPMLRPDSHEDSEKWIEESIVCGIELTGIRSVDDRARKDENTALEIAKKSIGSWDEVM